MEAQIDTGTSYGTGFDVPHQGLHLRHAGVTEDGVAVMKGVLDTSLGPVSIEAVGNEVIGWHGGADPTPPVTRDQIVEEEVIDVPEQFVALAQRAGTYEGVITIANRRLSIVDRDGVITIGG